MDINLAGMTAHDGLEPALLTRPCELAEYVPVVFARDAGSAERFKHVLETHGIPTLVESGWGNPASLSFLSRRIPLLVPEEMLDDASALVARTERQILAGFEDDDDYLDDDDFDDGDEYNEDDDDDDFFDDEEEEEL